MVQQRKAQRKETLGPKQSLPARASKRQCTVPHPLSGELQMAWEGWSDWGRWGGVLGDSPEGMPTMALTYVALTVTPRIQNSGSESLLWGPAHSEQLYTGH